jgi:hypothetical protein
MTSCASSALTFYKGLPEMFDDFATPLLIEEQIAHGIAVEHAPRH